MTVLCRAAMTYADGTGRVNAPVQVEVPINDGRAADLPGWRECGFELASHGSSVGDWTDDEEIATVHYAEAEELARKLTGCDHALVSDHVRRSAEQAKREREQEPVRLVHSDFAANYADVIRTSYRDVHGRGAATLARSGLTSDEIEAMPRIVMLQLWRNVGPPKMDLPVAWCDSRTLTTHDVKPFPYTGYVAGGRSFDALVVLAPDDPSHHGWYTFPELAPDEVVAFRTYDTELVRDGKPWFTPHSAFRDPDVALGEPARVSVELRVMCLFS